MMTLPATRKLLKARDIPPSWGVELPGDPEATVEVVITPTPPMDERSPLRFLGAAKGVYGSREEADAYLRKLRDEWHD